MKWQGMTVYLSVDLNKSRPRLNYKRQQISHCLWALMTLLRYDFGSVCHLYSCRLKFMAKTHECLPATAIGLLDRKFPDAVTWHTPFERQLLACYWTLIETASMIEGHKIIMKPEIFIMSWVISEKHSNKEGSAQKSLIIKQKSFIQEFAPGGMQGGTHHIQEQIAFFL